MHADADVPPAANLPRKVLAPVAARTAQRLYAQAAQPVRIAQRTWELQWSPDVQPPFECVVQVSVGPAHYLLHLRASTWPVELAPELLATQPAPVHQFAFAMVLAQTLDWFGAFMDRDAGIASVELRESVSVPANHVGFHLLGEAALDGGKVHVQGILSARSLSAWNQLWQRVQSLPEARAQAADEPLLLTLVLGSTRLSEQEMQCLETGAVVVVKSRTPERMGFHLLKPDGECLGECLLPVGEQSGTLVDSEVDMKLEINPLHADILQERGQIALTLRFELGTCTVSLQELQTLRPGNTVSLDQPLDELTVLVRCGDTCVGLGELVEFDGRLAVRLSKVV